jgi:hypothetical protein
MKYIKTYEENTFISTKDINKYIIFMHEEDMLYLGKISDVSSLYAYGYVDINIIYEYDYVQFEKEEINTEKVTNIYDIDVYDIFESSELENAKYNFEFFVNEIEMEKTANKYNL